MTAHMLIQHGKLITPTGEIFADLRIVDETIHSIGIDFEPLPGEEVIDARDCVVLPGLVDPHTHIQLDTGIYKTPDDWTVGTRTAACGGVTTVIDFATQFPGQDVKQAVQARLDEIHDMAHIDFGLHVMLTELPSSDDELDRWMADLAALGTPAAKVYTTYRPNYYQDDDSLLRVFRSAARHDILVMVHCENDALVSAATNRFVAAGETSLAFHGRGRPGLAEVEAVQRVLLLADEVDCPVYIVHCSVARSVEAVVAARDRGQIAFAETCPQYLLLDESFYTGAHPAWGIMQPPLRPAGEGDRLWQLLQEGAVSSLGTDHCDYTVTQKYGLDPLAESSVQDALAVLSDDEQEMVVLRAGLRDGWHREWSEVARSMGVTRDTVRRLETDALRRLRDANGALDTIRDATSVNGHPRLPFTKTPGGIPGLETALPLLATDGVAAGRLSWSELARLASSNPARLFGMYPKKGALLPGSDADIVIYDTRTSWTITASELHNIAGYTPYEGRAVRGRIRATISRGQVLYRGGEFFSDRGRGRFVRGQPFSARDV
ncbi:MAG: amidohydrolase family protein [Caldilineales bacterium]